MPGSKRPAAAVVTLGGDEAVPVPFDGLLVTVAGFEVTGLDAGGVLEVPGAGPPPPPPPPPAELLVED